MNTFTAILAFAAVCTLPACFAVPAPCGQIPPCDWSPCGWSPYTNLALANSALLSGPSVLSDLALTGPILSAPVYSGIGGIIPEPCGSIPVTVEKAVTTPKLVLEPSYPSYPCNTPGYAY